jgi:hypothetical protein
VIDGVVQCTEDALEGASCDDIMEQKLRALTGTYRHKGITKHLCRAANKVNSSFTPMFMGSSESFLKYLIGKNNPPINKPLVWEPWMPPLPAVGAESAMKLAAPWSIADVKAVTARSKIGKATNPLDKIPAAILKAAAGFQSVARARIVRAVEVVQPAMQEHLQMLDQSLESQGQDYYQMRVLEWTLVEAVGTTHPEDNLSVVFTGFKGKVESRVYSEEEKRKLCTRNDMWREIGLLTEHRKAFASALAHRMLDYADGNMMHCGIQLAYDLASMMPSG